jgi:hypothetical protein
MLVAGLLLSLRERMTLGVRVIFFGLFLTQYHTNVRGWGYIFIAGQDNQHMLRCCPGNHHPEDYKDQQYMDLFHHSPRFEKINF